jgi:hypothetical protein
MPGLPSAVGAVLSVAALVWARDAWELFELNKMRLDEMGVGTELRDRFLANRFFTPSKQTAVVAGLYALAGAAGRRELLVPAVLARSEEEALFYAEAATLLAGYSTTVERIAALEAGRALAPARGASGKVAILVPVDLLCWTAELGVLATEAGPPGEAGRVLWVTGTVSDRTRRELAARGWEVRGDARAALLRPAAAGAKP